MINTTTLSPTAITIRPEPQGGKGTVSLPPSLAPLPEASTTRDTASSITKPHRLASRGPVAPTPNGSNARPGEDSFWGADGFTFGDLVDMINPLQHIPIVSSIYQAVTGDTMAPGPRMVGGFALGGVIGLASAVIDTAVIQQTGKGLAENATSALAGALSGEKPSTQFAQEKSTKTQIAALEHSSRKGRHRYLSQMKSYEQSPTTMVAQSAPSNSLLTPLDVKV